MRPQPKIKLRAALTRTVLFRPAFFFPPSTHATWKRVIGSLDDFIAFFLLELKEKLAALCLGPGFVLFTAPVLTFYLFFFLETRLLPNFRMKIRFITMREKRHFQKRVKRKEESSKR